MTDIPPVLELLDISRSFTRGGVRAVDGVSLAVHPGEVVSLLGPSGCGKTTMMRMIAGLDNPDHGDIRVRGKSVLGVPPHRRDIGLVFQSLAAFPHMTVRENVAFGLRMQKMPHAAVDDRVNRMLALVQLPPPDFANRYPKALSGGQLQRVALARTLVTEPVVVLFDEPMAALDRRLRDYMSIELRNIQKRLGFAAIYVTHDQETASAMSDRLAIMRAGRIIQTGSPAEIYRSPGSRFVADFLGDANFLAPQSMAHTVGNTCTLRLLDTTLTIADAAPGAAGEPVVMVRPEHIQLSAQPLEGAAKGAILARLFKGGSNRWQIELPDGRQILAQSADDLGGLLRPGGEVWLTVEPHHARLLRQ